MPKSKKPHAAALAALALLASFAFLGLGSPAIAEDYPASVREQLAMEGASPLPGAPKDCAVDIDREESKWSKW
ncbi:MAG: hypothetical protein J2P54_26700 [Bradyrhizobiaceae bacterium]|nr:hypothetical protein [Bradyrhizobiaceae bacterium]